MKPKYLAETVWNEMNCEEAEHNGTRLLSFRLTLDCEAHSELIEFTLIVL